MNPLAALVLAYLIGAIPSSVWFGEIFFGKDVRDYGSGNAGATNTFRVLGIVPGMMVLLLDISKGIVAVLLAKIFPLPAASAAGQLYYCMALGLVAAVGHIFPVYLRFKGGKGVATFFGVVLYIFPLAALLCVITFFITFLITRYVSLGSILSSLAFAAAIFAFYLKQPVQWPLALFAIMVPAIIIYTHRKNIVRLQHGTESKMNFSKNKKSI